MDRQVPIGLTHTALMGVLGLFMIPRYNMISKAILGFQVENSNKYRNVRTVANPLAYYVAGMDKFEELPVLDRDLLEIFEEVRNKINVQNGEMKTIRQWAEDEKLLESMNVKADDDDWQEVFKHIGGAYSKLWYSEEARMAIQLPISIIIMRNQHRQGRLQRQMIDVFSLKCYDLVKELVDSDINKFASHGSDMSKYVLAAYIFASGEEPLLSSVMTASLDNLRCPQFISEKYDLV